MVKVELTPKEQKTVLTHCQNIDRDMYDMTLCSRIIEPLAGFGLLKCS